MFYTDADQAADVYIGTLDQSRYRELDHISPLSIINDGTSNKFVLNQYSTYYDNIVYTLNVGTYYITNIPDAHPIALLNSGMEDKISYSGNIIKKQTKTVTDTTNDADTYDFYSR